MNAPLRPFSVQPEKLAGLLGPLRLYKSLDDVVAALWKFALQPIVATSLHGIVMMVK